MMVALWSVASCVEKSKNAENEAYDDESISIASVVEHSAAVNSYREGNRIEDICVQNGRRVWIGLRAGGHRLAS